MKLAVILFNLGGPTSQEGVKPFLFNLFKDRNIIRLPAVARYPLAWLISTLRTKKAQSIYLKLGGGSPLNANTQAQVDALEVKLKADYPHVKVFMCMRYAPPMTKEVVAKVRAYGPDQIVLLPLYPQFSTTTTKSSFEEWDHFAGDLSTKTLRRCCYPTHETFIEAHCALITEHMKNVSAPVKILFSAHGIPMEMIEDGDPYAFQVEATVKAIMATDVLKNHSYQICYQSRVGPKKWLDPNIDAALKTCAKENVGAVVVPISFVSDHSETLVELDSQYKEVAAGLGLSHYSRVASLGDHPLFIESLSQQVDEMLKGQRSTACVQGILKHVGMRLARQCRHILAYPQANGSKMDKP